MAKRDARQRLTITTAKHELPSGRHFDVSGDLAGP